MTDQDVQQVWHGCTPSRHREVCEAAGEYKVTTDRPSSADETMTVVYEYHPFAGQVEERDGEMYLSAADAANRPQQVHAISAE